MSSFQPGDVIDSKYLVSHVLGTGGMGVVLACKHLALDSDVALKVLLPKFQNDAVIRERFLREARSASTIRSRHVVQILDVGTASNGAPYIVMERLVGSDLERLIDARGAFEERVAIDYVLQACDALAEAHALGIIHRDLKPENLFVTADCVKVLDFGISKASDEKALTGTAEVMGTPHFMAPEQFKCAKSVTAAADVWSLGAILYRLVTAALPFDAPDYPQLCLRIMCGAAIPIHQRKPTISRELVAIIDRCFAVDPAARFAHAGELRTALAGVRERARSNHRIAMAATVPIEAVALPPVTSPVEAPKRRRSFAAPLAALALAASIGALWTQRDLVRPSPLLAEARLVSTVDPLDAPASSAALTVQPVGRSKLAKVRTKAKHSPL